MSTAMRMRQRAFRSATSSAGSRRVSRNRIAVKAGLFDFLKGAPAAPKQNPRAKELVDELLQLCEPTDAGLKVTPPLKERIEELAEELSQYCIKNPVKSPLLWGEYQVVYTGNPLAIAGPFRQGPGTTIFPGQVPKQVLQAPNQFINNLEYKTLGFLNGYARQYGDIEFTSGSTFKVTINRQELDTGAGLSQKKEFTAYRNFEVIYLDDDVRVTRFLPTQGLRDDERDADGAKPPSPPNLFVFKRLKVEAEEEEEPQGGSSSSREEAPAAGTVLAGLRLPGRKRLEGAATLTERQVRRQMEEDSRRGRGGTGPTTPRAGTGSTLLRFGTGGTRPTTPEPQAKGADAKKQAAAAKAAAEKQKKEAAVAAKAAAEKQRKEAAAAKAAAEKQKKQESARAAGDKQKQEREAVAARERAAKEAAAEKERRAREVAAEKQRREAEAAAARERQAAIRDQLAQLAQELKERVVAKKDALTDLRAVERSNASVLKAADSARSKVEAVASSAASAEEALAAAKAAQQEAVGALRGAEAELKEVQKGTQKVLAGTARTRR